MDEGFVTSVMNALSDTVSWNNRPYIRSKPPTYPFIKFSFRAAEGEYLSLPREISGRLVLAVPKHVESVSMVHLHKGRSFIILRGLSSAGRAPALQAGGHRFDPDRLHQIAFAFGKSG